MKLLYDNLIQTATLSSDNATSTTNVNNLKDRILKLKYDATGSTDTVYAEWTSDQTISCIALGYHNLSGASYVLKNSGGSTIGSGTLEYSYDTNMTYFAAVSGVRTLEVSLTSSDNIYLGGLGCGTTFDVDGHNVNPRFDFQNQGSATWLTGGQTYGAQSAVLEYWRATIEVENSDRLLFKSALNKVGNWFPIYADLYEENHAEQRPIYGILQGDGQFSRDSYNKLYGTTIVVKEAR